MVSITTSLPGGGMVAEQKQPTDNDPESGILDLMEKNLLIYALLRAKLVE